MAHLSAPIRIPGPSLRLPRPRAGLATCRATPAPTSAIMGGLKKMLSGGAGAQSSGGSSVRDLMQACEGTERGLSTTAEAREAIDAAVAALEEAGEGTSTTDGKLSATWKLLWTTEQETLFILKNAPFFGTEAGEVYQVIDVDEGTLQNVITFPPDGAFIVNSGIEPEDEQRVNFKFTDAVLKLPKRSFTLPPFGQGWFESVYMDGKVRVAKDIRGDTLICVREGPARTFE